MERGQSSVGCNAAAGCCCCYCKDLSSRAYKGSISSTCLCEAFTRVDPKSANKDNQVISHFMLLRSSREKAVRKILGKLSPTYALSSLFIWQSSPCRMVLHPPLQERLSELKKLNFDKFSNGSVVVSLS